MDWLSRYAPELIFTLDWIIRIGLSVRIIMRRRPVGVSLAWLLVVLIIPIGGAVLYLILGETRIGRRRRRRAALLEQRHETIRRQWRGHAQAEPGALDTEHHPTLRLADALIGFPPLTGNALEILDDADAFFDRLIEDIDAAERTVCLEYYIWHPKGRTEEVVDAVVRAEKRGVEALINVDAHGSARFLRSKQARRLREAGADIVAALPVSLLRLLWRRADLRNHRKIAVIDGRVAYLGSHNMADPRHFKKRSRAAPWIDATLRVRGPIVEAIGGVFREDWEVESGRDLPDSVGSDIANPNDPVGGAVAQMIPSGPGLRPEAIHRLLLTTIYAAREELVLTTPYFVPDEAIAAALTSAARRGVKVRVVIPDTVDSVFVKYASASVADDMLDAGAEIHLYRGGLLHAKTITADGSLAIVGSVNLDMRSLWLNFEASLLVYDRSFAKRVRNLQQAYIDASRPRDDPAWRSRPGAVRFAENVARLIGPLL